MELTEKALDSRVVYEGGFLKLLKDRVQLPDGSISTREYLTHPGAVAILAILDNGNLLLERQHRYPLHCDCFEIPAGKVDAGEGILLTAQRELLEETGYVAREWTHLATAWPCVGYSDERIDYFLARGLMHQGSKPDAGELVEVFELSPQEAVEWVRIGKIKDSKTIVGLFWLEKVLQEGWSLPR